MRVVEAFSGIGSQRRALKQLKDEIKLEYEIVNTIEWDINSIYAYDIIHNGKQVKSDIDSYTKEDVIQKLLNYPLSYDGKTLVNYNHFNRYETESLKKILKAIIRTKNLVSIKNVNHTNFPNNIDVMTYSFPCQDLSLSGYFHGDTGGISRDAENSSSLLWEVERILEELRDNNRALPKILIMENVASITSNKHIADFKSWIDSLSDLGYYSQYETLNAYDFGVPQQRKRTFMISVYHGGNEELRELIKSELTSVVNNDYIENNIETKSLLDMLRFDYENKVYYEEAKDNIPNNTPSREDIYDKNPKIKIENGTTKSLYVRTLTTKQDRHPNSGVIEIDRKIFKFGEEKSQYRFITPRESFLLMGYEEEDYNRLLDNNMPITEKSMFITKAKLFKMAGNSIVVDVMREVFRKVYQLYQLLEGYHKP